MNESVVPAHDLLPIRYVSICLSSEVGRDDVLMAIRVVPDGQEGNTVFGRSLLPGELDDGRGIQLHPDLGQQLEFRPGSLRFSIFDADRLTREEADGYRQLTPTLWTWLGLDGPANLTAFNYLLATSRRLDGVHFLLGRFRELCTTNPVSFAVALERSFDALSLAEILVVALGRVVDLVDGLGRRLDYDAEMPPAVALHRESVRELRNACEHIEDRALGQVRGKPHPEALSIFMQDALLTKGLLKYGKYELSLVEDVPAIVFSARNYVWNAAVHFAGESKALTVPVKFFAGTQAG